MLPSLVTWLFFFWRESFCPSLASLVNRHKQMPSESSVIWCLHSKAHTRVPPRHTDAGGLSCGADLLLIVFLPTSVSKTFKQMFHTTRLISVWWCQMGDGAVLHLHMSFLFFIFPLCSGWGLVGWLKILWFSRDSEIYLSNLGVCVCVSLVNGCSCTCMIKIELKLERECISKNRKEKNALLKGWSQWWITYSIRGQKWPYKTKKTFFFFN